MSRRVPVPKRPPAIAAVGVAVLASLACALLSAPAARAHGGRMRVDVSTEPGSAPLSLVITARLGFPDGHPVTGLPVEISAAAPGQSPVAPAPMPPDGDRGTFRATVVFPAPGPWTVEVKAGVNKASATVEVARALGTPGESPSPPGTQGGATNPTVAVAGLLAGTAVALVVLWFVKRRFASAKKGQGRRAG